MRLEQLTARQREVVGCEGRLTLVLGGPGTGKTTVALWAARDELSRERTAPWQRVLFLTFSRTAVGQIASRAPGVFGGKPHRIEIATFHGVAYRLLGAFGRYAGHGLRTPQIQSPAEARLLGNREDRLTYDDLLPAALRLIGSERLAAMLVKRWPLVICDEFQDTSEEQWQLLRTLGANGRLLVLADPAQMIYSFIRGVGPKRIAQARAAADAVIELEARSHRDPSGVIPAMAESIRQRAFDAEPVRVAIGGGRLRVLVDVEDDTLVDAIVGEVERLRAARLKSIGIFAHSNEGVALLSGALGEARMDHVLVGIPESHATALTAMAALCRFGVGTATRQEAHTALAVFLTACTRGDAAPRLAQDLVQGNQLDSGLARRFAIVEGRLRVAAGNSVAALTRAAAAAWPGLRITKGGRPWRRSAPVFLSMARLFAQEAASAETTRRLDAVLERRLPRALVDFDSVHSAPIQLMNFYQTKGREADAVVLVYRDTDWFGKEAAPYPSASRVLFVSLTRARTRVVVILPARPHPLVAPFRRLVE